MLSIHNLAQLCYWFVRSFVRLLAFALLLRTNVSLYDKPHSIFHLEIWCFGYRFVAFDVCGTFIRILNTLQDTFIRLHDHIVCVSTDQQTNRPTHSNHLHPNSEVSIEPRWIITIIIKKWFGFRMKHLRMPCAPSKSVSTDFNSGLQFHKECLFGWPFLNFKQHSLALLIANVWFFSDILHQWHPCRTRGSNRIKLISLFECCYPWNRETRTFTCQLFYLLYRVIGAASVAATAVRSSDLNLMRLALKGIALNAATTTMLTVTTRRVNRISLHVTHVQKPIYKVHAIFNFPQFSLAVIFRLLSSPSLS